MGGSRVLVVEDDLRLASTLDRVLAAEGHDVEVAADGNDALHRARQRPFDLVQHFLRHPRQVLSREQLIDAVWKGEAENDNVVAVYVGYLRQKLGPPPLLHTVRGAGYALHE